MYVAVLFGSIIIFWFKDTKQIISQFMANHVYVLRTRSNTNVIVSKLSCSQVKEFKLRKHFQFSSVFKRLLKHEQITNIISLDNNVSAEEGDVKQC